MPFYVEGKRGTVVGPAYFEPDEPARALFEGMKGLGTDEVAVLEVIASHTNAQRQQIKFKYDVLYRKDLVKELDSELGGHFSKVVLALMTEPEEYILKVINYCMSKSRGGKLFKNFQKLTGKKGLAPEAFLLVGILWGRENRELAQIKEAYKKIYGNKMDKDIGDEFGEEVRMLLSNIMTGGRDESGSVDDEKVREDVWELRESESQTEVIQMLFNLRGFNHLRSIFDAYKELTGNEIEELIESLEFDGHLKDLYLAMVKMLRDPCEFFADRLKEAIEGADKQSGADDDTLISIIVLRSEIDLVDIILSYESKYAATLQEDVAGDTSGDYKRILSKLITIPEGMSKKGEEDEEDDEPQMGRSRMGSVTAEEMGVGTETEPLEDLLAAIDAQEKAETEDNKEDGEDEDDS